MTETEENMGHYRKKPVVVEAHQWSGSNWHMILEFVGRDNVSTDGKDLFVDTADGVVVAYPGWWIVRGEAGEYYPCAPDVFEQTFEEVEAPE